MGILLLNIDKKLIIKASFMKNSWGTLNIFVKGCFKDMCSLEESHGNGTVRGPDCTSSTRKALQDTLLYICNSLCKCEVLCLTTCDFVVAARFTRSRC